MAHRRSMPSRVDQIQVPAGYAGTKDVVALMGDLVQRGLQHPRIRARAKSLVNGLAPGDFLNRVAAVWQFVLGRITYVGNPLGTQHLTAPETLDEEIDAGDAAECCASISVYAASLLASIGIPSVFVIVGFDPKQPDTFQHCYLEVLDKRSHQTLPFDAVGAMFYPDEFGLGDVLKVDGPVQRWTIDHERVSLGDIDWNKVIDTVAAAGQMVASQFGPVGVAVGNVIRDGDNLYHAATGQYLGKVAKDDPANKPKDTGSSTGLVVAGVGAMGLLAYFVL